MTVQTTCIDPKKQTSSLKNLKIKPKPQVGHNVKQKDQLFADFAYSNPELPERDAEILREIETHRQAVRM